MTTETKSDAKYEKVEANDSKPEKATFAEFYQYADSYDIFLMIVGTTSAILSGFCQPVFCFLFGTALNNLNSGNIQGSIDELVVYLVILGCGNFVVATAAATCWVPCQ